MAEMSIEFSNLTTSPSLKTARWTQQLFGPLIAASVVRLGLISLLIVRNGTSALALGDTNSYLEPGRNLLLHGRFVADGVPDLLRTPGYSIFLAMTSLFGLPAAAVANLILSVFCVFLVWRLGRAVFDDDRIALRAAWIFAFEPISVLFSFVLLSETLFLTLLLLSLERLAMFLRGRRLRVLAAAGLCLAAATFVRPVTYYMPVAMVLGLSLVLARVPGLRWKAPAVLLISVLPWLAAWQIRNRVETGYGGFSSVREVNLYFFDVPEITARVEHRKFIDVQKELGYLQFTHDSGQDYLFQPYLALHPEQAGWSQGQRLAFMRTEAVRVIRAHQGVYLRSRLTQLFVDVFEPGATVFDVLLFPGDPKHVFGLIMEEGLARGPILLAKTHPWVAVEKAALAAVMLGLYLFAVRGVVLAVRAAFRGGVQNGCLWLLLGTSLYFLAVAAVAGGGGTSRFRVPIMPVVSILAAAGTRRIKTIAH
jgi:dolichyl-phosphate-mannose-protein mannosyltransferase